VTNFTPGPSQLYFTVQDHTKRAFREGIPSLSHRSKQFETLYAGCTEGIRSLLNIPSNYTVVFTGSATEIWERSMQSLVENHSHHYVNGAFSKRYFEVAQQLRKAATATEVAAGNGFNNHNLSSSPEVIALTHNETSTGVSLPLEFVHSFRSTHPESLIVVDAVSSLPYPAFDFSKVDSVFFSVQKGFGLPAGLGVWIVNDRCVTKAEQLQSKGISIGTYHSLSSLVSFAKKNQTPETPNVLGIYLLSKVVEDMLRRGIETIRKETDYKAAILYQALQHHNTLRPFVKEGNWQSKTVAVANSNSDLSTVITKLNKKGLFPGEGYGSNKSTQLRFANFPAHSKEQFELLVDSLAE
jgi:phosphoserine aminotransferase